MYYNILQMPKSQLSKQNKNALMTLATSRKKTKSGTKLYLSDDILRKIGEKLANLEYERKYSYGNEYFYKNYANIMRALHSYTWNEVAGPGGFIWAIDLPNDKSINYHNGRFREAVVLKKLGKIFTKSKFPISNNVKDAAISYKTVHMVHKVHSGKFSPAQYAQISFIQEMLSRRSHRSQLNDDYAKVEGFVDALLDEIEAEVKARK